MTKDNKSVQQEKNKISIPFATIFNLGAVLAVAIVIATLFTAWTPGQSKSNQNQQIAAITPLPTVNNEKKSQAKNPTQRTRPLIGIVSGHWGNDSGSVCNDGLTEAEVNLKIATLVQKYLSEQGYDVDLLKEFDPRLQGYKASALLSIHADSCDFINDEATGFKVAAAMANKHPERAARLTACIRSRYAYHTGLPLHSTSVTRDMTSYHAFGEIDENTPAAIIETGFLNLDRQFLTETPEKAAQGIAAGIICFLNNESIPIPTKTTSQ